MMDNKVEDLTIKKEFLRAISLGHFWFNLWYLERKEHIAIDVFNKRHAF